MARLHWKAVTVLFCGGWVIAYVNRIILAVVLKDLGLEWSLTKTQLGLISSAFFVMYALLQIPMGALADRHGAGKVVAGGFLAQGLASLICAISPGPGAFVAGRVLAGAGQSGYYASQYALATAMMPPERRTLGSAVINSGMGLGMMLGFAGLAAAIAVAGVSWRGAFALVGAVVLAYTLLLAVLVGNRRTATVRAQQVAARGADRLVRLRTLWPVLVVAFTSMYGALSLISWLPYAVSEAGFTPIAGGLVSAVMPAVGVPASLLVAVQADRLTAKEPLLAGLSGTFGIALACVALARSPMGLIAALAVMGLTSKLVIDPVLVVVIAEHAPADDLAMTFAAVNFVGTTAMVAGPAVTGWLVDLTGGFLAPFLLAGFLQLVGMAALCGARGRRRGLHVAKAA
ncbi:MAG: MFS transporter [Bacillota bacterium]